MGGEGSGLTVADALALQDRNRNDDMWGGNGSWVFFLFFLLAWGGGGFGFGGNGALQGALTRGELCQDMNMQGLENGIRGVQQGLCDGFYAQNTTMLNNFNGIQRDLCTGFANTSALIQQARFDAKECCCETNRNIDAVRYENARNTCDIVNAIRDDGNATRALITANQMQDLRDKLADRDRELMAASFQISQQAQTTRIIDEIKPCARPAYLTCSPYTSYAPYGGRGYDGYGYGYGGRCDRCDTCCG